MFIVSTIHIVGYRIIMTEAYTDFENTLRYYGSVDGKTLGAHFTFNFDFISTLSSASTSKDIKSVIDQWLNKLDSKYVHNWVVSIFIYFIISIILLFWVTKFSVRKSR